MFVLSEVGAEGLEFLVDRCVNITLNVGTDIVDARLKVRDSLCDSLCDKEFHSFYRFDCFSVDRADLCCSQL